MSRAKCGIESVETNAYINAKIELKKLTLNGDKCHKLHIGKCSKFCPKLIAHHDEMDDVLNEKYLGDAVETSGRNNKNIKARCGKLVGVISNIMYILKELCLGYLYIEVALLLRETMFLSVMLLNSETWINLTKENIDDLEAMDRTLLKSIMELPTSATNSLVYLELGCCPVRFIIMGKRLMFLQYILQRKETDLVSQVYYAQKRQPTANDWSEVVKEDLKQLKLDEYSELDIKGMTKDSWKKLVKNAIKTSAFSYLQKEAILKSKAQNLQYDKLEVQEYLTARQISKPRKLLLAKLRCRMVKVDQNYGKKRLCQLCEMGPDDQIHLTQCIFLKLKCPKLLQMTEKYSDLFTGDIGKLNTLASIFEQVLREREILLNIHEKKV